MLIKRSFLNALGTIVYIVLIAIFMSNASHWFGQVDNIMAPIMMLTLFVASAAITGGLVLGKPVLMYLDGQKMDAIKLFIYTVAWLLVGFVVAAIIAVSIR